MAKQIDLVWKHDASKSDVAEATKELVYEMCELNRIKRPKIIIDEFASRDYGWFEPKTPESIFCNIRTCRPIAKTPGYDWSYPGYKVDITPAGIIAHEFGHYVSWHKFSKDKKIADAIHDVMLSGERAITSYDHKTSDPHETLAEMMRLFVTNPDLLRAGRPNRWSLMTRILDYKPLIVSPWWKVLSEAHPAYINASEQWIKQGYKTTKRRTIRKCLTQTLW